jgi:hypothetical protein
LHFAFRVIDDLVHVIEELLVHFILYLSSVFCKTHIRSLVEKEILCLDENEVGDGKRKKEGKNDHNDD